MALSVQRLTKEARAGNNDFPPHLSTQLAGTHRVSKDEHKTMLSERTSLAREGIHKPSKRTHFPTRPL